MEYILTTACDIKCHHGGIAHLSTSNMKFWISGHPALLQSDEHTVADCPHRRGYYRSPCVRIEWTAGTDKLTVGGTAVLTTNSIGTGFSYSGRDQGEAVIHSTQEKVAIQ